MLSALIAAFFAEPDTRIWARYPNVSEAEDARTDEVDCLPMSQAFARLARRAGLDVVLVNGLGGRAGEDEVSTHWWVRLPDGRNVDWTMRQFHNIRPRPDLDDLQVPAIWRGEGHPIVTFRETRIHHYCLTPEEVL